MIEKNLPASFWVNTKRKLRLVPVVSRGAVDLWAPALAFIPAAALKSSTIVSTELHRTDNNCSQSALDFFSCSRGETRVFRDFRCSGVTPSVSHVWKRKRDIRKAVHKHKQVHQVTPRWWIRVTHEHALCGTQSPSWWLRNITARKRSDGPKFKGPASARSLFESTFPHIKGVFGAKCFPPAMRWETFTRDQSSLAALKATETNLLTYICCFTCKNGFTWRFGAGREEKPTCRARVPQRAHTWLSPCSSARTNVRLTRKQPPQVNVYRVTPARRPAGHLKTHVSEPGILIDVHDRSDLVNRSFSYFLMQNVLCNVQEISICCASYHRIFLHDIFF